MSNQQYDNTLRGVLYVNDRKTSPNQPDYKGSIETEDGQEYWASGWIKEPRDPKKNRYISIALTPKDEQPARAPAKDSSTTMSAREFLENNRDKADAHRIQPPAQPQQPPTPDYDSFDDDIPF